MVPSSPRPSPAHRQPRSLPLPVTHSGPAAPLCLSFRAYAVVGTVGDASLACRGGGVSSHYSSGLALQVDGREGGVSLCFTHEGACTGFGFVKIKIKAGQGETVTRAPQASRDSCVHTSYLCRTRP